MDAVRYAMGFNSRSREGATSCRFPLVAKRRFNSRSREGATDYRIRFVRRIKVSIHAPVRERLNIYSAVGCCHKVSIHAPVRERLASSSIFYSSFSFNSRSREGATLRSCSALARF